MDYYITKDDKGFVDVLPELEPKDGYTKVEVAETDKEYFLRYYDKYRVDDDGRLQAPGNLPDISIDTLVNTINQQQDQITQQTSNINGLQSSLKYAIDAQNDAKTQFTNTNKQFQVQFLSLQKQILELQKAITGASQTTATTDTTEKEGA
ncbi:hypothetical protein [Lentilactobacillus sp. SPB1-3]|uniref:Uncharacterized protein n=1 Tax=Lentilactobacillus terminaliae TaxID=3003483 RepID=A0ACD5DDB1_9LACO|nr:hypothetical protein [Lentilactobacillus sp. SPB1-3]MCZ0978128.1 hypothetical protein [Lentilactobacillus sp. SPB1-3]